MHIARLCPAGMIFVPCERGISHNEIENATPAGPRGRHAGAGRGAGGVGQSLGPSPLEALALARGRARESLTAPSQYRPPSRSRSPRGRRERDCQERAHEKRTRRHPLRPDRAAEPLPARHVGRDLRLCGEAAEEGGLQGRDRHPQEGRRQRRRPPEGQSQRPGHRLQRPCRHGGRRRAGELEERSLQGAGQRRPRLWPRRRQLQGQHGGAALARRGDRPARRPGQGRADLHLRRRRGEPRPRRHGVPAQERQGPARRADPGRADREQPDRRRARRDVGEDHHQGQGGARRQPVGRRQRHPAHDAAGRRAAVLLRQGAGQADRRAP